MILEAFNHAGIFAKLGMLVAVAPLGVAIRYAVGPTEQRLAAMRPLSLAAIFAALSAFLVGAVNVLQGLAATAGPVGWNDVALGAAEALVPLFLAFGTLAVAWICVAVGMRRAP
ncbi:MAG TPA: hypothetical protein VM364_22385 [Vicinamibacterales bacterium]|nr:hypothetical protein [Vicinamibacterales bacterium]